MPHYADGTLAEIGDVVVGTSYNTVNNVAGLTSRIGVILEITSQADVCNAIVGFCPKIVKVGYAYIASFAYQDYTEVRKVSRLAHRSDGAVLSESLAVAESV